MTTIELQDITKIFGPAPERAMELLESDWSKEQIREETGATVALDRVSLGIDSADVFVVMGLSGSGKSTLVRLVNRLIAPSRGDVLVDGQSVVAYGERELREFRRYVASMVFQRFALFPHKRVSENIAYGMRVRGASRSMVRDRTTHYVDAVGLSGYEEAYPHELSGGMQQRVGLARALATEPKILLMDEPFSALDPLTRRDMQDLLLRLQKELKKTVVFITHDFHEALRLGDRIAILKDGAVVQTGSPRHIIHQPANDYVRAFLRALPSTDEFA